ncbi:hypothetical protein KC906_03475 [Candidatus Kaiserbacteria bacterium]|nr:hypothetical protein [Candidatus Kaiserbacteria bacterium]
MVILNLNVLSYLKQCGRWLRRAWLIGAYTFLGAILLLLFVLMSVGQERDVSNSAATKQSLGNMRSQCEIYYNQNEFSYVGVCADEQVSMLFHSAVTASDDDVSSGSCYDAPESWAAEVWMQDGDSFWCVDYLGNAASIASSSISQFDHECGPGVTHPEEYLIDRESEEFRAAPTQYRELLGEEREETLQRVAELVGAHVNPSAETPYYMYDPTQSAYVFNGSVVVREGSTIWLGEDDGRYLQVGSSGIVNISTDE